jgi:aspartate-semialdehyde dehydrogenase
MVGQSFLKVLEEYVQKGKLRIDEFYLFASARSAGRKLPWLGGEYEVEELTAQSFDRGIDVALFSAGGAASLQYAPIAASKGCVVIDNSSAWRMDGKVPLIVPEVNPEDVQWNKGIIANPNCSTAQAVVALWPLHKRYGIKRVVYSTYQAVSGAGMGGWNDLVEGLNGRSPRKFPHPIAGNCLPHIDVFMEDGYTKEEHKMINETRKIMHQPDLPITATAVRIPVFTGHSESINAELNSPFELEELTQLLANSPGIILQNDFTNNEYPMPLYADGRDEVFVGRIRRDYSVPDGVNLWVVADNLRKGAATNAVQIACLLNTTV